MPQDSENVPQVYLVLYLGPGQSREMKRPSTSQAPPDINYKAMQGISRVLWLVLSCPRLRTLQSWVLNPRDDE